MQSRSSKHARTFGTHFGEIPDYDLEGVFLHVVGTDSVCGIEDLHDVLDRDVHLKVLLTESLEAIVGEIKIIWSSEQKSGRSRQGFITFEVQDNQSILIKALPTPTKPTQAFTDIIIHHNVKISFSIFCFTI